MGLFENYNEIEGVKLTNEQKLRVFEEAYKTFLIPKRNGYFLCPIIKGACVALSGKDGFPVLPVTIYDADLKILIPEFNPMFIVDNFDIVPDISWREEGFIMEYLDVGLAWWITEEFDAREKTLLNYINYFKKQVEK